MKKTSRLSLSILVVLSLLPGLAIAQTDPPAPAEPGPFARGAVSGGGFGAVGQWVISGELQLSMEKVSGGNTTFLVQPALDYFIMPNLSVGGVVGLRVTTGDPTQTSVSLGARAGYNLAIANLITFWPQAGLYLSHYSAGSDSDTSTSLGVFAPFLYHVVPHLFVGLGPFFDQPLGDGSATFGIHSVVGGWL